MLGDSLQRALILLKNSDQMEMLLTRIGRRSKIIITGDPVQRDIHDCQLLSLAKDLCRVRDVSHLHFSSSASVARHPIIPYLSEVFERRRQ